MNLIKGFYIINFIDSSFITYFSNNNFYINKKYIGQYDLYIKFTKSENFYIINEHDLSENIKDDLMKFHINKDNKIFMNEFIDKLSKEFQSTYLNDKGQGALRKLGKEVFTIATRIKMHGKKQPDTEYFHSSDAAN